MRKARRSFRALVLKSFPEWFAGFCFAAIALGALVPAAIMSIGAANLVTRNIWRPYINAKMTAKQESTVAKVTSLMVKFGALAFVVFLPLEYAINLQLLGGIWMLQVFPAIAFGLYTRWFRANALLAGWAVGMSARHHPELRAGREADRSGSCTSARQGTSA